MKSKSLLSEIKFTDYDPNRKDCYLPFRRKPVMAIPLHCCHQVTIEVKYGHTIDSCIRDILEFYNKTGYWPDVCERFSTEHDGYIFYIEFNSPEDLAMFQLVSS